jgi:hypothetical protein
MKIMTTSLVFADHVRSFMADCEKKAETKFERASRGSDAQEQSVGTNATRGKSKQTKPPSRQAQRDQNIQLKTEFIRKESSHESFLKNLIMFEQRFDSVVSSAQIVLQAHFVKRAQLYRLASS